MQKIGSGMDGIASELRRENSSHELVDRISALPDSILGAILSFLPTENAVATAFLSKRWRFVWRIVHNIDFYYDGCFNNPGEGADMNFVRFVDRVLLLHDTELLLKFSLAWNPDCISSSHANSWINTAIIRNAHELSLCAESHNYPKPFEIPKSVFSCDSLQSLELNGIFVSSVTVFCLPRLESLNLDGVDFQSVEAFEQLLSGCPKLNYLHIHRHKDDVDNHFTYMISSTSLRRLEIHFEHECNLKLNASSLDELKLQGCIYKIFVEKNLSSLVEADFRVVLDDCLSFIYFAEAVHAFDYAKVLTLSSDALEALYYSTINLSTKFKRLVKLETQISCCDCSLLEFIQSSDNLKVLIIHQLSVSEVYDHSNWTTPVEVPGCLSNRLKTVEVDGYNGYEYGVETIRYILKHGSVLEAMNISCVGLLSYSTKLGLVKEICKFPRKSPVCEVEFF